MKKCLRVSKLIHVLMFLLSASALGIFLFLPLFKLRGEDLSYFSEATKAISGIMGLARGEVAILEVLRPLFIVAIGLVIVIMLVILVFKVFFSMIRNNPSRIYSILIWIMIIMLLTLGVTMTIHVLQLEESFYAVLDETEVIKLVWYFFQDIEIQFSFYYTLSSAFLVMVFEGVSRSYLNKYEDLKQKEIINRSRFGYEPKK